MKRCNTETATMIPPLSAKESFTIACPLDVNPRPLIELLMQSRYKQVPAYEYVRADNQSFLVTMGSPKTNIKLSIRQKKVIAIIIIAAMFLLCQERVLQKQQHQRLERNAIKSKLDKSKIYVRSLKMNKALSDILRLSIYIRKIEVTPMGWSVDIMGASEQTQKLSSSWKVTLPVVETQEGMSHIKGGGTWLIKD